MATLPATAFLLLAAILRKIAFSGTGLGAGFKVAPLPGLGSRGDKRWPRDSREVGSSKGQPRRMGTGMLMSTSSRRLFFCDARLFQIGGVVRPIRGITSLRVLKSYYKVQVPTKFFYFICMQYS